LPYKKILICAIFYKKLCWSGFFKQSMKKACQYEGVFRNRSKGWQIYLHMRLGFLKRVPTLKI